MSIGVQNAAQRDEKIEQSYENDRQIRSKIVSNKSEDDECDTGDMGHQPDKQVHPMIMIQSGGSMTNSRMKKKSIERAKESLGLPITQKNQNQFDNKNHHNKRI